jgi:hypothetical protein
MTEKRRKQQQKTPHSQRINIFKNKAYIRWKKTNLLPHQKNVKKYEQFLTISFLIETQSQILVCIMGQKTFIEKIY